MPPPDASSLALQVQHMELAIKFLLVVLTGAGGVISYLCLGWMKEKDGRLADAQRTEPALERANELLETVMTRRGRR